MDGLEKITARISADADAEIQAIRDKAQAQAEELLAQASCAPGAAGPRRSGRPA